MRLMVDDMEEIIAAVIIGILIILLNDFDNAKIFC